MYSMVMLAAMTASPEAPDFFKNKGGCYGCYGGGCYGSSCYGCYGGGWGYGNGGMFGHKSGYGGGYAFVGSGCCGGYAAAPYYTSCCGYAAASGHYDITGRFVPPAVSYAADTGVPTTATGVYPAGGVYPGYPGYSTTGGTGTRTGTGTTGTGTDTGTPGKSGSGTGTPPGPGGAARGTPEPVPGLPAGRAQLVVRLPADAKLFADGNATMIGGVERVFLTPEISTVRDYTYTLKAEYAAGDPETRQVTVRAGYRTVVEFAGPVAAIEKASSPVTVTLPAKAKLFVDGVAAAADAGTHTFRTPDLTKGKPYVYQFRAEVEKDGKTEVLSREVTFKAGEPVVISFVEGEATRTASAK
jgi:uncharacterized protein (TIGR03000 family)